MEIIYKNIDEIKTYGKNPRKNDKAVKYVAESIEQFGFKVPIVIDKNNIVICGHTRLKASKQLGINKIPCIIADDLTDDQIKAFRLADNKVSEQSEWDFDLLNGELSDLIDFDMGAFGFDVSIDIQEEAEESENERLRTDDAYNLQEFDNERTEGFYQMPIIEGIDYLPNDLIGFNYMLSSKEYEKGIHFFIDDYQFERIWNSPQTYIEKMAKFDCVLTPDFSLYTDMPKAMMIWNIYRSRMIGQMCQDMGLKVIPTVSWADADSFAFCFDGLPKKSTLAISTVGIMKSRESQKIFKQGCDEMIKRLQPKKIICYGLVPDYDFGKIEVKYIQNRVTERMENK